MGYGMQWGLILTGKVLNKTDDIRHNNKSLRGYCKIRTAATTVQQFMRVFANQFILGETLPKH